jgi:hypothetical protein
MITECAAGLERIGEASVSHEELANRTDTVVNASAAAVAGDFNLARTNGRQDATEPGSAPGNLHSRHEHIKGTAERPAPWRHDIYPGA